MLSFQVIASFENYEQDIFDFDIDKYYIDEESFITEVLKCLENVDDLYKLSICQFCTNKNEIMDWLLSRNGKYFFNVDANEDEDTKYWNEFRNKYIKKQNVNL